MGKRNFMRNNYQFVDSLLINDATYIDYLERFKKVALSAEDNKGFLCQYHKDLAKEKAKEMADNYGITVDELLKAYGSLDIVKYDIKMHKALEIIKG